MNLDYETLEAEIRRIKRDVGSVDAALSLKKRGDKGRKRLIDRKEHLLVTLRALKSRKRDLTLAPYRNIANSGEFFNMLLAELETLRQQLNSIEDIIQVYSGQK